MIQIVLHEAKEKCKIIFLTLYSINHKTSMFQKNLLVHQDDRHLLLINVEYPCQYTYLRNLKRKPCSQRVNPSKLHPHEYSHQMLAIYFSLGYLPNLWSLLFFISLYTITTLGLVSMTFPRFCLMFGFLQHEWQGYTKKVNFYGYLEKNKINKVDISGYITMTKV